LTNFTIIQYKDFQMYDKKTELKIKSITFFRR